MTQVATNEKTKSGNQTVGEKLISRIKITPNNTLEISYKLSNDKEAIEALYIGKEEVMDKYLAKFADLYDVACQIVPLLSFEIENDVIPHILRLKYNDANCLDKMSLSVKLNILASNSPINISTPMVDFVKEDMSETAFRISQENEEIIHEIIAMTKAYMNGETRTKQLSLVVDNEG